MPSRIEINGTVIESPVAKAIIRVMVLPVALVFVALVLFLAFAFIGVILALAFGLGLVALTAAAVSAPFWLPDRRRQKQLPPPDSDESGHD